MRKYLVFAMILIVSLGPLFRGLFFPFEMYMSFAALSFLAGIYIVAKYRSGESYRFSGGVSLSILIMILSYFLAFFRAANPRGNIEMILQLFVYFLLGLVLTDFFHDKKEQVPLFFSLPIIGGGVLAAVFGLAGYTKVFTGLNVTVNGNRIGSTLQYANTAAVYFLMIVLMLIYFMVTDRKIYFKITAAALGHILLMALFFTSSRGVFLIFPPLVFLVFLIVMPFGTKLRSLFSVLSISLPMLLTMKPFNIAAQANDLTGAFTQIFFGALLAAGLMLLSELFWRIPRTRNMDIAFWFFVGAVLLMVGGMHGQRMYTAFHRFLDLNIPKGVLDRMQDINLETRSAVMRFEFYKEALTLIKRNPIIGYGGYGFASLYQSVQKVYYAARLVHNHYLQVFVEAGLFGFLGFVGTMVFGGIYYFYGRLKEESLNMKAQASVLFCALLALSIHSAIDFNLSYSSMGYLLYALTALGSIYGPNEVLLNFKPVNLSKKQQLPLFLTAVLTFSLSVPFSLAANQIEVGQEAKKQIVAVQAITAYERAAKLDPLQAGIHAELADLYSWMARTSRLEAEKQEWLQKAVAQAERALKLDPHYPYYNRIAANVYFSSDQPEKAKDAALYLIEMQPLVKSNFEILAKAYTEAGLSQIKRAEYKNAKADLEKVLALALDEELNKNKNIIFYAGKAALALGQLDLARGYLDIASAYSLELRMEADRMLYLINQLQGIPEQNEKYSGLMWMGLVEVTPLYKELKDINERGLLINP